MEIIGPILAQDLEGNRGGRIAALPRPGIMTFAIRSDDLDTLSAAARREGLSLQGPAAMSRDRPDGVRLDWTILYLEDSRFGEAIPFVIDWGASPHPSESVPAGCRLRSFAVLHPKADELARLSTPPSTFRSLSGAARIQASSLSSRTKRPTLAPISAH